MGFTASGIYTLLISNTGEEKKVLHSLGYINQNGKLFQYQKYFCTSYKLYKLKNLIVQFSRLEKGESYFQVNRTC